MKDPHDIRKAAIEDQIIARSEEASTVLSAWQSAFGTTQLSHAIAERDRWKEAAIRDDQEFKKALVERDQLRAKCERLEWDIEAYRGALGYSINGSHTGKLTDGTTPQCGLCNSEYRLGIESRIATLLAVIEQCEGALEAFMNEDNWHGKGKVAPKWLLNQGNEALAAIKKVKEGK